MAVFIITHVMAQNTSITRVRVLVLCPVPLGRSPGQRFRYEQYIDVLKAAHVDLDIVPFLDAATCSVLYARGAIARKIVGVLAGFCKRLLLVARFKDYDRIFIFREGAPLGPPIIEWLAVKSGRPVLYDFDDAIFLRNASDANRFIAWLKYPSRVRYISKKCQCVSVCNQYLLMWAKNINSNTVLVPTTIDLEYHRSKRDRNQSCNQPVIGWTGSHSTVKYLDIIRPALVVLQEKAEFQFRVICDRDPGFMELKNYLFVPWRVDSEIADLDAFDIGLMPVPDGLWEKGKVGFKAIQYGAMEIPSVVSNTGSGAEVVEDGRTGFVVENTTDAWVHALGQLLADRTSAAEMGRAAREHMAARYSTAAFADAYIAYFRGEV